MSKYFFTSDMHFNHTNIIKYCRRPFKTVGEMNEKLINNWNSIVKYDDIVFVSAAKDKWKHADIMVDDADKVLGNKPLSKVAIKIEQTWNTATTGDISIPNIKALSINIMKNAIEKLKNKTTL